MRLLLDTHAFLWWCASDSKLSSRAHAAIADADHEVHLSVVSGWEIAIKARLGRLPLPSAPEAFVRSMLERHAFTVLPITMRHALADFRLPVHHGDPFDRLLVAQASAENLTLVTNDALVQRYEVPWLW